MYFVGISDLVLNLKSCSTIKKNDELNTFLGLKNSKFSKNCRGPLAL